MDDLIKFLRSEEVSAQTRKSNRQYKDSWSQYDREADSYDFYLTNNIPKWIKEIEASRVKVDSSGVVEIDQNGVRSVNRG